MRKRLFGQLLIWIMLFGFFPTAVRAAMGDLSITEIMYDLEGADTDREWIEIHNNGGDAVTIPAGSGDESLRVYEEHGSTKHNHTLAQDAYQGGLTLPSGGFAVIAQDGALLKSSYPAYSGHIFVASAMSLSNTAHIIGLKIGSAGALWSSVSYSNLWSANGDGKSLQWQNGQWVAASPTPGFLNDSDVSAAPPPVASQQAASPQSNGSAIPKSIRAFAGDDATVAVGSVFDFSGHAIGLAGEPLETARFWWNFGDGETKEGKDVWHIFRIPGTYLVGLHVSSGSSAASDYATITVVPNQLKITSVIEGGAGSIRLFNESRHALDVGGWMFIDASGKRFVVPEKTKISAQSKIAFANAVTGLLSATGPLPLIVLYPNGSSAFTWNHPAEQEAQSVRPLLAEVAPPRVIDSAPSPAAPLPVSSEHHVSEAQDIASVVSAAPAAGFPSFFSLAALVSIVAAAGFLILKKISR